MENIESVTQFEGNKTHWVVSAPAEQTVEWDAILTKDTPGKIIAWESVPGADIRNSGTIEFRDGPPGRGTEVTVTLSYDAPGGAAVRLFAKLFRKEPKIQLRQDMRRFKQLMETGEIPVSQSYSQAASPHSD